MKRLFAHTLMAGFALTLLTACPSKEGSEPAAEAPLVLPDPVGPGEPEFVDINKAFYEFDAQAQTAQLNSFDPDTVPAVSETVFAGEGVFPLRLNTLADARGEVEYTVFTRGDSVFRVNHRTDEIRFLHTFPNRICGLYPKTVIDRTEALGGTEVRYQERDDFAVFVKTSNGDGSSDDCIDTTSQKVFYELSLNYRFDAPRNQRCVDEDGEDSNPETCLTRELPVVDESFATATPVYGYTDDTATAIAGDQQLEAALLGFDSQDRMLRLYDVDRTLVWEQPRELQVFAPLDNNGMVMPATLFAAHELNAQHYLIQLGRDVFVIDGSALFDLSAEQINNLLDDRVYQLEALMVESAERIAPVHFTFDDDELMVHDGHKLFFTDYLASYTPPTLTRTFVRADAPFNTFETSEFAEQRLFSQFELFDCVATADPAACALANNPRDASWRFFEVCDAALGCALPAPAGDDCDTEAERAVNPALDNPCSPSNYRHLTELNASANDLDFAGFMPFAEDYVQDISMHIENDQLWLVVQLNESDLLMWFDYDIGFTVPADQREGVVLGDTQEHFGLAATFNNGDLYVNALEYFATRSNECYKDFQRVTCQLSELSENGGASSCTGLDVSEGRCVTQFNEYKSRALFCSAADLAGGACSDANLAAMQVESSSEDAQWLEVIDQRNDNVVRHMYVLLAEEINGSVSTVDIAEGRLLDAEVRAFDPVSGLDSLSLGVVEGPLESALGAVIIDDDEGRLNVVSEEIREQGGSISGAVYGAIQHVYLNRPSGVAPQALSMGESTLLRPTANAE